MKRCQKLTKNQIEELQNVIKTSKQGSEVKRAQAIIMVDEEVDSITIMTLTAYKRRQIFEIRKNYLEKGLASIIDRRKGESKKLLTKKQRAQIVKIVKTKIPNEIDAYYNSNFWTTSILGEYIKRTYNVAFKSRTSLYLIFKESRFTFHKPGRVYEKHDEQEVKKWQKETKPIIKKAFQEKNTVILCEDEMILSTQTTFQKIWLPQGEYPKIEVSNTKQNRSLYGFLNVKNGREHAFKTERQTMYITAEILKKIRKIYSKQKLLILWDGAGWHRGSVAQDFIKEDGKIKTIYFPKYSPEENPQEHVWKSGREQCTHNEFIADIDKATDKFVDYLNKTEFKYSLLGFSADS